MTKIKAPERNILTAFGRSKLAEGVQAYFGVAAATQVNGMHVMLVAETVDHLATLYRQMVGVELDRTLCYSVGVTDGRRLRTAQWPAPQPETTSLARFECCYCLRKYATAEVRNDHQDNCDRKASPEWRRG